jgi:hypothetical protein
LSPIPGTALFTRLEKEKRITRAQDASTQELTRDNFIPTLVYDPVMPVDQLLDGYQRVLSEVCDPVRVYERSLTLLSRLPDLKLRELRKKDVWRQQKTRAIVKLFPLNINFIYQLSRIFFTSHGIYFARFLALSSRYGLIALVYAIGLALHTEHLVAIPEKVRRRRMVAGQN